MAVYSVTLDTGETHEVRPRPVDQFGYLRWARPALGVEAMGDDSFALATYGVTRALIRTGTLAGDGDLLETMTRVVDVSLVEAESDPTQSAP